MHIENHPSNKEREKLLFLFNFFSFYEMERERGKKKWEDFLSCIKYIYTHRG